MKCRYCGGEVSLTQKYCPYCGKLNDQTAGHAEAMEKYQKDYAETKAEVMDTTRRFGSAAVSAVIIAVLAVLILASIIVGSNAWDIRYAVQKRDSVKNEAEYSKVLENYLKNEEYLEYDAYVEYRGIDSYHPEAYTSYRRLSYVVSYYSALYETLGNVITARDLKDASNWSSSMTRELSSFYEEVDSYRTNDDVVHTELHDRSVDTMEYNVELLLDTYLGMDKAILSEFRNASSGRKLVILEDALAACFGGEI